MNCIRSMVSVVLPWLLLTLSAAVPADELAEVAQLNRAGQSNEAMAKLDQFLALKPKDPQLRFMKGVMLAESKRTAEAIAVLTLLNEDYPELPEPYNNLAVLYASQGQYDMARAALETAVRGNPGYATAYENLGDVYVRLAAQAYAKAQSLDPASASLPSKIGQLRSMFTAKPAAAGSAPSTRTVKATLP